MSPGILILAVCLVGVGLAWGLSQWLASRASTRIGQPVQDLLPDSDVASEPDTLLWFHSPTCGPCRAMEPAIQALIQAGRARAIDVTEQPEVARMFGVMATPTTVRVKHGQVEKVHTGFLSASALEALAQ